MLILSIPIWADSLHEFLPKGRDCKGETKLKKTSYKLLFTALFVLNSFSLFAKDNLAVLPFTGGRGEDGETIAELFMFDQTINGAFTLIPRTSITRAMRGEQRFQYTSGLTDPVNAVSLGHQLGAKYIIAGNIAQLGDKNLLVVGIINTETLEEIAGDIQTFTKIEEMPAKIPAMAQNIVAATKRDTSKLPKLAATRVAVSGNDNSGDVLAQILAIYLIRYGSYAVYPRTKSLEQVQAEWDNQLSGDTADENMVRIGAGENPLFALSCVARRLGDQTMFNASIINLKSGAQDVGTSVNYKTINDGMEVMQTLASKLSTGNATETEWRVDTAESFIRAVEIINNTGASNYAIILTGSFTLSSAITFSENASKTVTITGDSQMRTINNCHIFVSKGIYLVLGNNVTLDGNRKGTVVYVFNGSLTLQEGAVLRNGSEQGGVYIDGGIFTMNGGTISGNKSIAGGGVFINSKNSTFIMNGGTISGNTATENGGGVSNIGDFRMIGGTISGNTANKEGGGVANDGRGTFTITGGTISGNTAGKDGGGVWSSSGRSSSFIKTGGTIDETNSAKNGKIAYAASVKGKRNSTAGPNDNLDSSKKGRAGGWE
jgi:TolB-like protein